MPFYGGIVKNFVRNMHLPSILKVIQAKNGCTYPVPGAIDKHIAGLIYYDKGLFINGPVVIGGHIDEFDCFRRAGRRSRRFLLPEVKVFQDLFY